MDTPSDRLKHARVNAGFSSATKAAQAFKWNENTYRSHENGERDFKRQAATGYAQAFKTTVQWLLFGEGSKLHYVKSRLGGYVSDLGRIIKNDDGIDVEIIGLDKEVGLTTAFLVQTVDLEPRFELHDIVIISEHSLDFSPSESWMHERIWCYVESSEYRPVIAKVKKFKGTNNITLEIPSHYGDNLLSGGVVGTTDIVVPVASLRTVRTVQNIVTQHGWRYGQRDVVQRLKAPPEE